MKATKEFKSKRFNYYHPTYALLLRILFILAASLLIFFNSKGQHSTTAFSMSGFNVEVTNVSDNIMRTPTNTPDERLIKEIESKIFQGKGKIMFQDHQMNVNFKNVKVKWDQRSRKFNAIEGTIKTVTNETINYNLDGFKIYVSSKTITINPEKATAKIKVVIPSNIFSSSNIGRIEFSSPNGLIAYDGSIYGTNFKSQGIYHLSKSVYAIELSNEDNAKICIGSKFSQTENIKGISFNGLDSLKFFKYDVHISPQDLNTNIEFVLTNPISRLLESGSSQEGYRLTLLSGKISFNYKNSLLSGCSGSFQCDLKIPPSYGALANGALGTLNITLKTDETGILFNKIKFYNYKFKLSETYSVQALNDSAWVFFPQWIDVNKTSDYEKLKASECDKILALLNRDNTSNVIHYDRRPGLTLLDGIIYLNSPQVSFSDQGFNETVIKSIFNGGLTFTPFGITGDINSAANTFVPYYYAIDSSSVTRNYPNYIWQEILDFGDNRPPVMKGLFKLQDLKILYMGINNMSFCANKFIENKASLTYKVHFPYPSYINLFFEDLTLDKNGYFHVAKGPITAESFEVDPAKIENKSPVDITSIKDVKSDQIPETHILWAWRLPISFVDRGVIIDFNTLKNSPDKGIIITLDTIPNNNNEIYSNELWISPLFSKKSAVKKGVRVQAYLSAQGDFNIKVWDHNPFFGQTYTKKFESRLDKITLNSITSLPSTRTYDFKWDGSLWFPYFNMQARETWQFVDFSIKDMKLILNNQIKYNNVTRSMVCCSNGAELERFDCTPNIVVSVNNLMFDDKTNSFYSTDFSCNTGQRIINRGKLELYSFTHALIIPDDIPRTDITISENITTECGEEKHIKEMLKDAVKSKNIIDLICHDPVALAERALTISMSCCKEYYYGTYNIISIKNGQNILLLESTNVKYFESEIKNKLEFTNSVMKMHSEDNEETPEHIINIPGMQLSLVNGAYYGAFGATYTPLAMKLPYEGEFRFYLNPKCGYFYTLGAGTFTYFEINFKGLVFIFHAPIKAIKTNPFNLEGFESLDNYETPDILTDMTLRSLMTDTTVFLVHTGLKGLNENDIITGFITTGNASKTLDYRIVKIYGAVGAGVYFYQVKSTTTTYKGGTFAQVIGKGEVDFGIIKLCAMVSSEVGVNAIIPSSRYDNIIDQLCDSDAQIDGKLEIKGCIGVPIGHCEAEILLRYVLSNTSGFSISGSGHFDAGCDWGNCPGY